MKQLTFIDMFAGIGGFHSGMEQAGHKCVGWIEWDKYARQSYQAIYDTEGIYNAKDIQNVSGRDLPDANVWCFGSPCTNISLAGNRKGLGGEQSLMFFEVIRLLKERTEHQKKVPEYLIMENVKNLLSSNGGWDFAKVQIEMEQAGYDVEWNVFNSAEVVPQNRERVYIVGHLRGRGTAKVFPIRRESKTTTTIRVKQVGNLQKTNSFGGNPQVGRVYSPSGVSPTLNTMQGGGREPKILIKNNTKLGYLEAHNGDGVDLSYPTSNSRRGRVQNQRSNTLETSSNLGVVVGKENLRIRKLTPLECWRLQGFSDEQFYKAKNAGVSNSQLYKQAGNAVTVPVVKAIAERMGLKDD